MMDVVGFGAPLGGLPALRVPAPLFLSTDSDPEIADRPLPIAPASSANPPRRATATGESLELPVRMEPESAAKEEPLAPKRVAVAAAAEKPPSCAPLASGASTPAAAMEQIAKEAALLPSRGAARIRIALSPAHLGELLIDLSMGGALLHGKVQTGSDAARDLILSHLDLLRQSLEQQGIQVGEFQVSVDPSFHRGQDGASEGTAPSLEEGQPSEARIRLRSIRTHVLDVVA